MYSRLSLTSVSDSYALFKRRDQQKDDFGFEAVFPFPFKMAILTKIYFEH